MTYRQAHKIEILDEVLYSKDPEPLVVVDCKLGVYQGIVCMNFDLRRKRDGKLWYTNVHHSLLKFIVRKD